MLKGSRCTSPSRLPSGTASGNPHANLRSVPWALLPLIAPFNTTMSELIEMRTYWRHPLRLDNHKLVELLGEEPHTPLAEALPVTLKALGCIPA